MKGPDVTLTNGRYEFRSSARGSILYLSDPPEAGWHLRSARMRARSGRIACTLQPTTAEATTRSHLRAIEERRLPRT